MTLLKRKKGISVEEFEKLQEEALQEAARSRQQDILTRFPWMESQALRETPGVVSTGFGIGELPAAEQTSAQPEAAEVVPEVSPRLPSGFVKIPEESPEIDQDVPPPPLPGSLAPRLSPPYPPSLLPTPSSPPQPPPSSVIPVEEEKNTTKNNNNKEQGDLNTSTRSNPKTTKTQLKKEKTQNKTHVPKTSP